MVRVLMVCLGNICRSPLAEGILRSKVDSQKIFVDSAGTANYHVGDMPDGRSVAVAGKNNIDISAQRGRQFSIADFDRFDFIYVMDNYNRRDILSLARNDSDKAKVQMILNEVFPGENVDVPDPYYGGEFGFESVFKLLDTACTAIAEKL